MSFTSDECWVWQAETWDGYGYFHLHHHQVKAHRWVYEHMMGPIPAGLELDHLCRNRSCVNPAHLEPVTHRVNVLRGLCPPAVNARKTHCVKGHEYTPENTYTYPDGRKWCLTCKRAEARAYQKRKREARVAAN